MNRLPPRWQQQATCWPTYSMARAIWATEWQKGFICRCHYLCSVTVEVNHELIFLRISFHQMTKDRFDNVQAKVAMSVCYKPIIGTDSYYPHLP